MANIKCFNTGFLRRAQSSGILNMNGNKIILKLQ